MKKGSLILGLLAGACIGAIGGLLLAPHKGSLTRKMIARRGDDYVEILKERFDEFLGTIDIKLDKVKKDVADYIRKGVINFHDIGKHEKATLN